MAGSTKTGQGVEGNSCWVMMVSGVLEENTEDIRVVTPRITAMGTPENRSTVKHRPMNKKSWCLPFHMSLAKAVIKNRIPMNAKTRGWEDRRYTWESAKVGKWFHIHACITIFQEWYATIKKNPAARLLVKVGPGPARGGFMWVTRRSMVKWLPVRTPMDAPENATNFTPIYRPVPQTR